MWIVYLHGFASSPQSGKAQFFKRKFEERGIPIAIPELDRGDFERVTVTGMLEVVEDQVGGAAKNAAVKDAVQKGAGAAPAVLIGSSLGGFIAGLYAARHPAEVERLVLLAPALQFAKRWEARFSGEELDGWKRRGWKDFYHYARKRDVRLGYSFVEDAMKFEDEPEFAQPALILHGSLDDVVPVEMSRDYVRRHPNAALREFGSGHELTDVTEDLWRETAAFLGIS